MTGVNVLAEANTADRILSDRLAELLPGIRPPERARAAGHVQSTFAALLRKHAAHAGPADLDQLASALTDAELILLLLAPPLEAGHAPRDDTSAPFAHLLLASASVDMVEKTLDALARSISADIARTRAARSPALPTRLVPVAPEIDRAAPLPPPRADEAALLAAARDGDTARTTAILAAASGLPAAVVRHAARLRNAKALVSMAWKAGFTMQAGLAVQTVLGELPPSTVLEPGPAGRYPLSRDEMEYHIALITARVAPG